jgi:hypothetical protein
VKSLKGVMSTRDRLGNGSEDGVDSRELGKKEGHES